MGFVVVVVMDLYAIVSGDNFGGFGDSSLATNSINSFDF